MSIDAFSLQIAWNGLRSICDESFLSLMRSSFSTNIKERHDHSTAVVDPKGRLVAQAELSLPIHLASMTGLISVLMERYAGKMKPGDIYCANDPHVAGGTHLPDINLAAPVFSGDELIGFVANIAHHADVGGAAAGSMSGGLTEVWQEGVRIPLVKLVSEGETQQDVLDLMLLNMRLPQERMGDLNAQIAACRLAEGRLKQMASDLGTGVLGEVYDEILTRSEQRMRAAISAFPDGTYEAYVAADFESGGIANQPGATAMESLLHEIVEEKYVSLVGQIEVFNDIRRTENLLEIPSTNGSEIPNRFLIPQVEINANANTPNPIPDLTEKTPVNM